MWRGARGAFMTSSGLAVVEYTEDVAAAMEMTTTKLAPYSTILHLVHINIGGNNSNNSSFICNSMGRP